MLNAFMMVSSYNFVVETFQSMFKHQLQCFGIFIDIFPNFLDPNIILKASTYIFMNFYLDLSHLNLSLGFLSIFLDEDILRGLKTLSSIS